MKAIQTEQQIIYNLLKIGEQFPQYTLAQHMVHFLRSKGDKDPYFWTNEKLLSKVESYYDELNNDLANDDFES